MIIKQLIDEDFTNYKKPSMFIGFPRCSWKCDKECGMQVCQNGALATAPDIVVNLDNLIKRYLQNRITTSLLCGGLEPFDSWEDLKNLIICFREKTDDDIVIYTGYLESEISEQISWLKQYKNIIVKFGRFIPNQNKHYDEVLGVNLASDNQYARRIDNEYKSKSR
jgi:hypothetical protein